MWFFECKLFFRSLTSRKFSILRSIALLNFMSKSDALQKYQFKFSHDVFFFNSKSDKLCKFCSKILSFKKGQNCKVCHFHGVKRAKMWFFECKLFFRSLTSRKFSILRSIALLNFMSKSDALQKYQFKFSHDVFFFNSKSDKLCKFCSKILSFKKEQNCKICRFHGVKRTKTWYLECKLFFEVWHLESFPFKGLTRC